MALPRSKSEFKEYVLRKLGSPVIQINISDEQLDDRVDEALSFWRDYHYDGSELIYLKHELTQEDSDRGYIDVPERLLGVSRIFDLSTSLASGAGMFNVQYQFALNNISDIAGYNVQNYYMSMQHLSFIQEVLIGKPMIRYNRHMNKLYIDEGRDSLIPGLFVVIEAYDIIDGDLYADMWQDRWLQNYTAALVREQWGSNITKYTGLQLVGGVQFNGEQILQEAKTDRKELEEQAINSLQPLSFNFIG